MTQTTRMTVDMTQSILSKLQNTHDLFHVVVDTTGIIFILIRHVLIREAGTFCSPLVFAWSWLSSFVLLATPCVLLACFRQKFSPE